MPTDSIIDNLYVFDAETDEKHKLGHVKDIELTTTGTSEEAQYLNLKPTESYSGTIEIKRSLVYQLDVIIGHKFRVPNNWLKRHHISMNRRKAYGK